MSESAPINRRHCAGRPFVRYSETCSLSATMIGLIVKGSEALFLEGVDPGSQDAGVIVDRLRAGSHWPLAVRLDELGLKPVPRPRPLKRSSLSWA